MNQMIILLTLLAPLYYCQDRISLSGYYDGAPTWDWGQRLPAKVLTKEIKKTPKKLISQRPFLPFSDVGASAGPFPRNDGTTKSRNTQDTLLPGYVTNGLEEGFTTLDVMQKKANNGKIYPSKIKGSLGGLDPREVYYADEDLIIIKGGGFRNNFYQEPSHDINSISDLEETKWSMKEPTSLHEEYNGNIATIVAPPSHHFSWWNGQHSATNLYSPLSLFLPANAITGQESNVVYRVAMPYQYPMTPIRRQEYFYQPQRMYFPLPYRNNYRYFGNGGIPLPITQNEIISQFEKSPKPFAQYKKQGSITQNMRLPSKNSLVQGRKPVTYLGDTNVNYLDPKPSINSDAEIIPQFRPPK